MICSICEQVPQVPTGTRIPTAFRLDLSPQGSAAASQADGNCGGEHLPREQVRQPTAGRELSRNGCAKSWPEASYLRLTNGRP